MSGRRLWWYAALAGVVAALPCTAYASAWAWPVSGPVSLAFGSQWTDPAGRMCTHGGLDISSESGEQVLACAGGRVTFAGRVPSAGGGSTLAVSVIAADGIKYTCMPLSELAVSQGQDVQRETVLGSLARSGDSSSDAAQ
jgi:murein DD-endopeptidase MepM/ murein hydrolase activator NlpD